MIRTILDAHPDTIPAVVPADPTCQPRLLILHPDMVLWMERVGVLPEGALARIRARIRARQLVGFSVSCRVEDP